MIDFEPVGAAHSAHDLSTRVLRPILHIRGLTAEHRAQIEELVREAERAEETFTPDRPTGIRCELYIERMERVLARARAVVAKYQDD